MRALLPFLLLICIDYAPSAHAQNLRNGFAFAVATAPTPVTSGGKRRFAYEIRLTNFADVPLTLDQLESFDAIDRKKPLAGWSDDALQASTALAGSTRTDPPTRTVAPGRHAILYVDFALALDVAMPKSLVHRLAFHRDGEAPQSIDGAAIDVARKRPVQLGAPLGAGDWVAIYDAAAARGHRRVAFAFDGTWRVPARYAIDWMRVDADGRLAHGDEQQLDHWLGYDADVLAVADARVVALRDAIAEPAHLDDSTRHPLEEASGNYISLDLGDGRYVHYEHLKPGSVRVHVGERVRRGDVIARLGYTGDSTGPHLHMHVSDGATPLAGEGLPFVLDHYEQTGIYASMDQLGSQPATAIARGAQSRHDEFPQPGALIRFKQAR